MAAAQALSAMSAMAALGVAVFFLRFWRQTADRLFALLALAFVLMGTNWIALALLDPARGNHLFVHMFRLAAFLVIVAAIVDKNRARKE